MILKHTDGSGCSLNFEPSMTFYELKARDLPMYNNFTAHNIDTHINSSFHLIEKTQTYQQKKTWQQSSLVHLVSTTSRSICNPAFTQHHFRWCLTIQPGDVKWAKRVHKQSKHKDLEGTNKDATCIYIPDSLTVTFNMCLLSKWKPRIDQKQHMQLPWNPYSAIRSSEVAMQKLALLF